MRCRVTSPVAHGDDFRAYVAHRDPAGEPLRFAVGESAGAAGPACWPCATWWPTERQYEQVGELAQLISSGIEGRMVRCVPHLCGGTAALADWSIGPLAVALTDLRCPLALDLSGDQPVDLRAVFDLAVRHPTLPIVLRFDGSWDTGLVLALLRTAPNLVLETSGLADCLLERAVQFDVERLVFGSDYPDGDPGARLDRLRDLVPGPDAFELIAAGNAAALLQPCDA